MMMSKQQVQKLEISEIKRQTIELVRELRLVEKQQDEQRAKLLRSDIVELNIRLVRSCVNAFMKTHRLHNGLEYGDLLSEGVLGMYRAIDKFDPDRGFTFATYANTWIGQKVRMAIKRSHLMRNGIYTVSMDEPTKGDSKIDKHDRLADERLPNMDEQVDRHKLTQRINRACNMVRLEYGDRMASVIETRYGPSEMFQKDIGKELGVSKQRAEQLEKKFLSKTREYLERAV